MTAAKAGYLDGYGGGGASSYASYTGYAGGGGGGYAAPVANNYYSGPAAKEEAGYDYYVSINKED